MSPERLPEQSASPTVRTDRRRVAASLIAFTERLAKVRINPGNQVRPGMA